MATVLYYLSTATNWRLEWLHHADTRRSLDQSLSLVLSHRPSWRQSLSEWRVFLKWSRAHAF